MALKFSPDGLELEEDGHVKTVSSTGVLQRTSPSALDLFQRCETAWWLRYVAHEEERIARRIRLAQQAGTTAHAQLEDWAKGGPVPTDLLARALMPFAPPVAPGLLVETNTDPLLVIAGIVVTGRIDWTHNYVPTRPIVADWKTRSDLDKYAKTEEELRRDVQMNCYAAWAWLQYPEAEVVDVAHYYVETKWHKNKDTGVIACQRCHPESLTCTNPAHAPRAEPLVLPFNKADTDREMLLLTQTVERMKVVARMRRAAEAGHPTDYTSKNSPCTAFMGCGYKHACVHHPSYGETQKYKNLFADLTGGTESKMPGNLQELIEKRKAANAAAAAPAAPAPTTVTEKVGEAPTPGGILRPETPYVKTYDPKTQCVKCGTPNGYGHAKNCPMLQAAQAPAVEVLPEAKTVAAQVVVAAQTAATKPVEAVRVDAPPKAEEHVHVYGPGRTCECGAKQRGPKPKAGKKLEAEIVIAPEPEVEEKGPGKIELPPGEKYDGGPVEVRVGYTANIVCDPPTKVTNPESPQFGQPIRGAVVSFPEPPPITASTHKALLVNAYSPKGGYVDLSGYVAQAAQALAEKAIGPGHTDPRFVVEKNNPMGYGGWRGALAEYVKANPPPGNAWSIWTRGDDLAETVAMALASLPDVAPIFGR